MFGNREMVWFVGILFLDNILKVLCQCSGSTLTLTASEIPAKFTSPNYPSNYADNSACLWLLDSGVAGQPVMLYGDDMFLNCNNSDFITIYDGPTQINSLIKLNLCTTAPTLVYISSDRYMLVEFNSDPSNNAQGFELTYISAADTSATGCTAEYALTATTSPQYLTSAGFPATYSSGSSCRWLISGASLSTLNITITWSDIENGGSCEFDALTVYDGQYMCENSELIIECSTRETAPASTYTTTANHALVIFTSDASLDKYGFVLEYQQNPVVTTSTTSTTTTTSTTVSSTPTGTTSSSGQQSSSTDTETQVDIPLLFACAIGGAGFVVIIVTILHAVKFLKAKKLKKSGMIKVQTIAPLPARTAFDRRQGPNTLSFV
ncbi:hypothetical protein ACF0H5_010695 [Mactra antiquata]